ncbi:TIGR00282 family metallophosphoesterase [Mycoplasma crocodyli]|uniref:Ser/Thr protein phosphatase family protein n=1 Tax=Mycoplasma crocodyli (strain ATCC 51981 / MP145) TaxID=512564 RepID=D5E502_MYCCM|nr:TIGR00282 family metallophosphoesterase [Mycoplasma crocodyli]ADE19981.1 Ser/Thr protein phosphatase family protein [Mycoplasma crocodyli MP145]
MNKKGINLLFLGDVFGELGIKIIEDMLPGLIKKWKIDFVVAQSENVSDRKGFIEADYLRLKAAGVNAFTLGNHVWSKPDILKIINNEDIIRPLNIEESYPGKGSNIFTLPNDVTIRVTSLMGITFNHLLPPWEEEYANNFFDYIDDIIENGRKSDFHFIDFHAETTSEKNVLALYLDGKIDGICGTHTHVQTNDARILPNGTAFITDAGMSGPSNCAIGANFQEVYEKMRYGSKVRYKAGNNEPQFNGVLMQLNINKKLNKITPINIGPKLK